MYLAFMLQNVTLRVQLSLLPLHDVGLQSFAPCMRTCRVLSCSKLLHTYALVQRLLLPAKLQTGSHHSAVHNLQNLSCKNKGWVRFSTCLSPNCQTERPWLMLESVSMLSDKLSSRLWSTPRVSGVCLHTSSAGADFDTASPAATDGSHAAQLGLPLHQL